MPQVVIIVFWLTLFVLPMGIILTIISWITDSEKLEKTGIRVALVGLILLVLTFGACTAVLFNSF